MNELEKAYNGIEDAIGSLDYEGNYDVDTPRESLEYIKAYINNLQSKIDKANEILYKLEMQPAYLDCKYYELDGFNELKEALKEDK